MALPVFLAGEACGPFLAAGVGVLAAAVFIITGAGGEAKPREGSEEAKPQEGSKEATKAEGGMPERSPSEEDSPDCLDDMIPTISMAVDGSEATGGSVAAPAAKEAAAAAVAATDSDGRGEAALDVALPSSARKRLTPEQEAQIKEQVNRLPPESRKALEDWINMSNDNKYLIAWHGINVYDIQAWRNGTKIAEAWLRQKRVLSPRG